jgi:YVTN family beta-propeller protein
MFNCETHNADEHQQEDVLTLTAQIPLPGVTGRIDHLAYDSVHKLVFIAALGNNSVEVVNINTKQVIHSIKGLRAPQGIAYIPSLDRLVVANDDNGEVDFYDMMNYKLIASVDLKDDADNIRYNAEKNLVYVGYGNGGIAIIDAKTMKQVSSIKLDAHPESFQLSKRQNRIYINVPDAGEIEIADLSSNQIVAKWKNTDAFSNFPMALDEEHNSIFIGYRNPATLATLDMETGKNIGSIKCSGDADDLFYSAKDSLVFISTGKGFIDVFKSGNQLEQINHISTRSGARTSLWLNSKKEFLLAVPKHGDETAALWVYDLK